MKKLVSFTVGTIIFLVITSSCSSNTPIVEQQPPRTLSSTDQIKVGCEIWLNAANNADSGILTDEELRLEIKNSYDLVILGDDEAIETSAQKLLAQSTMVVSLSKRVGLNFDPKQELDPAIALLLARNDLNSLARDFSQNCSRY